MEFLKGFKQGTVEGGNEGYIVGLLGSRDEILEVEV